MHRKSATYNADNIIIEIIFKDFIRLPGEVR